MRILWRIALSLAALSLSAQSPGGLPDIMGTGSVAQVASSGSAITITFIAPSSNTSHVRVGGPGISTTNGIDIAPGGTWYYQALPSGAARTGRAGMRRLGRQAVAATDHHYSLSRCSIARR
jgi:hypothetical protein